MSIQWTEIGPCRLACADSRDVLETIEHVHATVTDPPYGVRLGEKGPTRMGKTMYEGFEDTPEYIRDVCATVVRMSIAISDAVIMTPGTNVWAYPPAAATGCIYNPAGGGLCSWGFITSQPLLYYGKDPHFPKKPQSVQWNETSKKNGHPCPKPERLMMWMVDRVSLPGQTVLDPFLGSGRTGVACVRMGRKFIGIELVPKYFDIACAEIERAVSESNHGFFSYEFSSPKVKPEADVGFF